MSKMDTNIIISDTKTQERFKYYKSLGLTVGQALLLSMYSYGSPEFQFIDTGVGLYDVLKAYKKSKYVHNKTSLSQLVEKAYNNCSEDDLRKDTIECICNELKKLLKINKTKESLLGTPLLPKGKGLFGSSKSKVGMSSSVISNSGFCASTSVISNSGFGGSSQPVPDSDINLDCVDYELCSMSLCMSIPDEVEESLDSDFDYEIDDIDDCEGYEEYEDSEDSEDCIDNSGGFVNSGLVDFNSDNIKKSKTLVDTIDFEENRHRKVIDSPTSTFKASCSKVALDLARANVSSEKSPRLEEIINYPKYKLGTTNSKFRIVTELMEHPDDNDKQLLFVGIKGSELIPQKQNVVVLLDVSGSMSGTTKETQLALITLISKLNIGDKFSLITYSDDDTVVIDNITIREDSIDFIIEQILGIKITGCTYGSKGLYSAYQLIHENKIEDGVNRIVLLTDGDFNFSLRDVFNISGEVQDIVLAERNKGAYISVIGCGRWLDDKIMSTVARNGNGNYCVIYDLDSVDRNINKAYNELMHAIAKDVKIQVEFNPAVVEQYKLFGYETRALNHEDFKNDKIIAEPFGSGAQAIALYELTPVKRNTHVESNLRYQKVEFTSNSEVCTVSLRYKDVESEDIKQVDVVVPNEISKNTDNCKIAYRIVKDSDNINKVLEYIKALETVE